MIATHNVQMQIISSCRLTAQQREAIIDLCNRAYEEDLTALFNSFAGTHVLGFLDGHLATHAMWVTRWLQVGKGPLLRTAYVELVATDARFRNRGLASTAMRRLASEVGDFDIAALSPFSTAYYARLGWVAWQGPLYIRKGGLLLPTPEDEEVMVLRLPRTPVIDLAESLSVEWREGEVW